MAEHRAETFVIGGVDNTRTCMSRQSLIIATVARMRSFGDIQRVGIECSGSYRAGLLRDMQTAGIEILKVTAADKEDRRRHCKNDDFDAESAATQPLRDGTP